MPRDKSLYPSRQLPQLNIRLPVDLYQQLEAAVKVLHRNRTQITLEALSDYFERFPAKYKRRWRAELRQSAQARTGE